MSVIVASDAGVAALVHELAGDDAIVVMPGESAGAGRTELTVARRGGALSATAEVPTIVVDGLGCPDRERLMWRLDLGTTLSDDLVAQRCRVAELREDEIADHLAARASSPVAKALGRLRRLRGGVPDRSDGLPAGAGVLAVDPETRDLPLPAAPSVSIVVPTRDAPDLLDQIVAGVQATRWPDRELVLVDNGTTDPQAGRLLATVDARVERLAVPFNFPRLCNRGAHAARGDVVVMLNNDVELVDDRWLDPLVDALRDPGVGVAGALLTYPDGTLQHAGMAIVDGVPVHPLAGRDPGSSDVAPWIRSGDRTAVTAACLAIRRATLMRLGGFDPLLAHDYNDLDLCLRAWSAGYRVHLASETRLVHHESKSRGRGVDPQTVGDWLVVRARWRDVLASPDAHWNPS